MNKFKSKADAFRSMHIASNPLVLWNVWDAGSAKAIDDAGAAAIATGSFAVAGALGFDDGEQCPRETVLQVLRLICRATDLPVTHDAERGYGSSESDVADYIHEIVSAGAVGINLEDSIAPGEIRAADSQAKRLSAAKSALGDGFLNARTDVFFAPDERELEEKLEEVVQRSEIYAIAGADGLFVPGLVDLDIIEALVKRVALPLNIMRPLEGSSLSDIAQRGVSRISHGPFAWLRAMNDFRRFMST